MSKYGFNENEVISTKTLQIDKDGFHRIVEGSNSDDLPLPVLYVRKDSYHDDDANETINSHIMFAITKISEVVYGTETEQFYPIGTIIIFSNNSIDFSELPANSKPNNVIELLENKNVHYAIAQCNSIGGTDTASFENATTDIAVSIVSCHSETPALGDNGITNRANAGYSWFLNINKNDNIQTYTICLNADGDSIFIKKFGNFLWPYEKSISYNPDGALKATPASGEFSVATGVILNLEGTGKYGSIMDEIFISDVDYQGAEKITNLSDCCSILSTLDNTSQNIRTANGFNTIDGTVTISGGFFEGENTLYVYGCTKDASNNWVIKERATVKFNYAGNVV